MNIVSLCKHQHKTRDHKLKSFISTLNY